MTLSTIILLSIGAVGEAFFIGALIYQCIMLRREHKQEEEEENR